MLQCDHCEIAYTLFTGEQPVTIRCRFLEHGIFIIPREMHYEHPMPTFTRIFLFRRGGCRVYVEDESFDLDARTLYLLPLNQSFTVDYRAESELCYFHLDVTDSPGMHLFRHTRGIPMLHNAQLIDRLMCEYPGNGLFDAMGWQSVLVQATLEFAAPWLPARPTHVHSPRFNNLIAFVKTHGRDELDVAELARMMGMTRSALSKAFQRQFGMPLSTYVTQVLLERARLLLEDTELPVQGIAMQLGFRDPYYFHRLFKQQMGTSPLNYRRQVRSATYPAS